jgi:hypothetical protein
VDSGRTDMAVVSTICSQPLPLIDGGFHKIWVILIGRHETGKGVVEETDSGVNSPPIERVEITQGEQEKI